MKKFLALFMVLVMALSLVACQGNEESTASAGTSTSSSTSTITPPSTTAPADTTPEPVGVKFSVIVTNVDGTSKTFEYTSSAASVGEALLAEGLIAGDPSDYGLYVTTVNGITANWETEKSYWAFYINGEYAMTGVDSTPITEGATYSFVKTISEY